MWLLLHCKEKCIQEVMMCLNRSAEDFLHLDKGTLCDHPVATLQAHFVQKDISLAYVLRDMMILWHNTSFCISYNMSFHPPRNAAIICILKCRTRYAMRSNWRKTSVGAYVNVCCWKINQHWIRSFRLLNKWNGPHTMPGRCHTIK